MELEFVDTLEVAEFGKWRLLLQEYFDNENDKEIYNVSLEYMLDDTFSQTIDLFESYNLDKATRHFLQTKKNIIKTNNLGE